MNLEAWLHSKIVKLPNGCWEWVGSETSDGYGLVVNDGLKIKSCLAHRFMYQFYKRLLGPKVLLLHSCDNPACCNPDHMFEGTYTDNAIDARNKGRSGGRKLTDDQIRLIYENPWNMDRATLATVFAVSTNQIGMIQRGQVHQQIVAPSKRPIKRKPKKA